MKMIIISGPSGSGKTTLAAKIEERVINGIVLSTDNYYKTGLISKLLSRLLSNYFDRKISFNQKLFSEDLNYIADNKESKHSYLYDFNKKTIKKIFNNRKNIKFIIIEGIFATELIKDLKIKNIIFIELTTTKSSCMKRVINRDVRERGKNKLLAKIDFLNSWNFYKQNKNISSKNKLIKINFSKENDFEKFLNKIFKFIS